MTQESRKAGEKFLKDNLCAQIKSGHIKFYSAPPIEYIDYKYTSMDSFTPTKVVTENSVDIHLRQQDYDRLIDILGSFYSSSYNDSYYEQIAKNIDYERSLRKQHKALQKAYEKYEILLKMVINGNQIED